MKFVYELVIVTKDGVEHSLLFSSKRKAENHSDKFYVEGVKFLDSVVDYSFVVQRSLF